MTENPYDRVCSRCKEAASIHGIRGRRMICHDGEFSTFDVWEVVEVKRALGHKIPVKMAFAAKKSKEVWDAQGR